MNHQPALAVHGGAWNIPKELWPAHQAGIRDAHASGMSVLMDGGSAIEAIAVAIRALEDDPTFDAGYGSFLNEDGEVEMDAGLMDGKTLKSGAILGVRGIRNPIDLARHVLEHSPHCLFTGPGALRLADKAAIPRVADDYHVLDREKAIARKIAEGDTSFLSNAWVAPGHDTVGAIALDRKGNLAAGNSTGGTRNKAVGRVGDAAIVGSGFYADNQLGAVVCTGWGEPIMQSGMAMRALYQLSHLSPQAAAESGIIRLRERAGGFGGLLVMTPQGRCGVAFNTERMAFVLPPQNP